MNKKKKTNLICRLTASILTVLMLFGTMAILPKNDEVALLSEITAEAAASDHTADDAINWVKSKVGTAIDVDGMPSFNPYQCVDLIDAYMEYLGVNWRSHTVTVAADFTFKSCPAGWTRIQGATPQKGDVIVYTGGDYLDGYGYCGHVAIYENESSYYQQNVSNITGVVHSTENATATTYVNYWGVLRPNFKSPYPPGHVMTEAEAAGQTIPDGNYWIASNLSDNYLVDIPGNDYETTNDTNLQMWKWGDNGGNEYDLFHFEYQTSGVGKGFYRIYQNTTNQCINVSAASTECGANVDMWEKHNSLGQFWSIEKDKYGCRFRSMCNGFYLDVTADEVKNDTNLCTWAWRDSGGQVWNIRPGGNKMTESAGQTVPDGVYWISSKLSSNYLVDIPGNDYKTTNGTNLQMWKWGENGGNEYDLFRFEYQTSGAGKGFYRIYQNTTNQCIDVTSASIYCGANVDMWEKHDSLGQFWSVEKGKNGYRLRAMCSGFYLDVTADAIKNDTNLCTWAWRDSNGQLWDLISVKADCNADGKFTVADIVMLQKWLLAVPDAKLIDWKAADLCEDGVINVFDLCMMKRLLISQK